MSRFSPNAFPGFASGANTSSVFGGAIISSGVYGVFVFGMDRGLIVSVGFVEATAGVFFWVFAINLG